MAELDFRRDRGQLLLVFAIGLAVAFVTLALILNAAIASELRSTTADQGTSAERAVATYEQDVWAAVAGLMDSVNAQDADSVAELHEEVVNGTTEWNELAQRQHADDATFTRASVTGTAEGTRIVQTDQNRTVTNRSGAADWAVVGDDRGVWGFRMNVSPDGLAGAGTDCADCFNVTVQTDELAWSLFVYEDGNDTVLEEADTGQTCRVTNASADIDFDDGSLNDRRCSALAVPASVSEPRQIAFENGDQALASYELTVEGNLSADPHFAADGQPTLEEAIYSASVSVSYRSPDLVYASEFEVVPGGER